MRTIDLVGRAVLDPDGRQLGRVVDLRLVDARPSGGALPTLRVDGLVVSPRRIAAHWGYDRYAQQGPWLLRRFARWWQRPARYVRWEDVRWPIDGPLHTSARPEGVPPLPQ